MRADQYAAARTATHGPGRGLPIDLHAGLAELDDRAFDDEASRAEHADADGCAVRLFGPEDHLRLLALHALRHGVLRPLWLCDVAAAIEGRLAAFDWDRFLGGDPAAHALGRRRDRTRARVLGARLDGVPDAARADAACPRWLVPVVLRNGGRRGRRRAPAGPWRTSSVIRGRSCARFGTRWPNAVEATVGVGGSFSAWPRLPYQVAECARRSARFVAATGPQL